MAYRLSSRPKNYDWGVRDAASKFLGLEPTGEREAEVWWGNHPLAECSLHHEQGAEDFGTWLNRTETPFPLLVKLLAAEKPLSIQAHPSEEQAREGFHRQEHAGISLSAPERTYKDRSAKPELIIALSQSFGALVGFAEESFVSERISRWVQAGAPPELSTELLPLAGDPKALSRRIVEQADTVTALVQGLTTWSKTQPLESLDSVSAAEIGVVKAVAAAHPDDGGLLFVVLMHHLTLSRGQGLFLPSGLVHAYLSGVGLEVMLPSDNVVRAGLTTKHVDAEEFFAVGSFEATERPVIVLPETHRGVDSYGGFGAPFAADAIHSGAVDVLVREPAVCIVEKGHLTLHDSDGTMELHSGDVVFALPGTTLTPHPEESIAWMVYPGKA